MPHKKKSSTVPSASGYQPMQHPNPAQYQQQMQAAMTSWLQAIHDWYPDLHTRTYFLPPVRFNQVPYEVATIAGQPVLVPQPASNQPASSQPASSQPASNQPASGQPASNQPASSQPASSQPASNHPASSQPASNQPASGQPASNQPASSQPASSQPASSQPASNQPASSQPVSSKPSKSPAVYYPAQPIQMRQLPGPPLAGSLWPQQPLTPTKLPQVLDSTVRDDAAIGRFLHCLRVLAMEQKEVMMVISELDFRKYLDHQTDPISTAACALFPRPTSLAQHYHHGDFDVLIIHRHYGLIVGEVKSVGADLENTQDLAEAVVKRVKKAAGQLNKAEGVLSHLVSDMAPVRVTKTLILPNITSAQLLQALGTDAAVKECLPQALCQCLDSQDLSEAISLCLCKDQMPATQDLHVLSRTIHLSGWARLRRAVLSHLSWLRARVRMITSASSPTSQLSTWWQNMVLDAGPDPNMAPDLYEQLLARFCGPATTVDVPTVGHPRKVVRSEGQAVAETGLTISSLALYPYQVDILNKQSRRVYLCGPPGSGKTIVLVLKAMQWLNQGKDVDVVSFGIEGRAVSVIARQQLHQSLATAPAAGTIHHHHFDFDPFDPEDVTAAVKEMEALSQSRGKPLNIIVDEAVQFTSDRFSDFFTELVATLPTMSVWAAGLAQPDPLPPRMFVEKLTISLRCPPAVQREIEKSTWLGSGDNQAPRYTSASSPAVTDGPQVRWLRHKGQAGHSEGDPGLCERCGEAIADELKKLGVGVTGHDGLQWRDVFILCMSHYFSIDDGILRALRNRGVPVRLLNPDDPEDAVRDVALALSNQVTVTDYESASSLERRVVIGLGEGVGFYRLLAMSRCTAQLVWVDEPVRLGQ